MSNGAQIVPIAKTVAIAPRALAAAIGRDKVTVMFLTTHALFNAVAAREAPDAFRACLIIVFGGETADALCVAQVMRAQAAAAISSMPYLAD